MIRQYVSYGSDWSPWFFIVKSTFDLTMLFKYHTKNNIKNIIEVRYPHLFKACLLDDFLLPGFQDIKKDRTIIIFFYDNKMIFEFYKWIHEVRQDFKRYSIFIIDMNINIPSLGHSSYDDWRLLIYVRFKKLSFIFQFYISKISVQEES